MLQSKTLMFAGSTTKVRALGPSWVLGKGPVTVMVSGRLAPVGLGCLSDRTARISASSFVGLRDPGGDEPPTVYGGEADGCPVGHSLLGDVG